MSRRQILPALHLCCEKGHISLAEKLIARGADVNIIDKVRIVHMEHLFTK
jgi:ankyrin repeat protein